jgi:hypothetical protein
VPPKDRLWFKKQCTCDEFAGCGKASTSRWQRRLRAAAPARRRAEAERKQAKAAAEKADREEAEQEAARRQRFIEERDQLRRESGLPPCTGPEPKDCP